MIKIKYLITLCFDLLFKEYKQAIKLLKDAYLPEKCNIDTTQRNIDLLSDLSINYGLLKSAKLHVKANNKANCQCNRKKTFIQRFAIFSKNFNQNFLLDFWYLSQVFS